VALLNQSTQRGDAPSPHGTIGVILALGIAAIVASDPFLASTLGHRFWTSIWLDWAPLRITLILLLAVLCGGGALLLIQRVGDTRVTLAIVLLLAAQITGLRAGPLDMFDAATGVALAVWLFLHLAGHPTLREVHLPPAVMAALFFVALQMLHLVVQKPAPWLIAVIGAMKVMIVPFIVVNILNTRRVIEIWADAFRWIALGSAVVGIVQFSLAYFGIFSFTLIGDVLEAYKQTPLGFVMRASGLAFTAQHFSGFLLLSLPFWLMRWTRQDGVFRPIESAAILVILTGIAVSWNFSAILAAAVLGALFPILRWPRFTIHILLAYASISLVAYYTGLLDLIYATTLGDKGIAKGAGQRMFLSELGFEKLWRDPLVGTGMRGMADFSGNFWKRPVHNAFLQAFTELGLAGVLLFTVIIGAMTVLMLHLGTVLSGRDRDIPVAVGLGIVGFSVASMTEPNIDNLNTWLAVGVAAAILNVYRLGRWKAETP
jgi:hypothetical protein